MEKVMRSQEQILAIFALIYPLIESSHRVIESSDQSIAYNRINNSESVKGKFRLLAAALV